MQNSKWVVYNGNTLESVKFYKLRRFAIKFAGSKESYQVASIEHYTDVIQPAAQEEITVRSAMNGAEVTIRRCDQGGPCDPSTERYWSM